VGLFARDEAIEARRRLVDSRWIVSLDQLLHIANLIPPKTYFWESLKGELEIERDQYLHSKNAKYSYENINRLKSLHGSFRGIMDKIDETTAHIIEIHAFFYKDHIRFGLSINCVGATALFDLYSSK
jgi:hypothetical protein